ncbi:MAG: ABC transporter permease [Coriobacteriia bacterium]|nr:ABC transporter permease [Coriobacteriia bacterium]MBS5478531.1 ABC transporter permease [Coriobacteriia bacterium]
MFEKLGKARYVVPVAIVVVMSCFLSLMFYPMMHMQAENLPFAVLNLDEGAETPKGTMNVGEQMIDRLRAASSEAGADESEAASPIAWTQLGGQEELDEALANNEYYGALVIPAGYTAAQLEQQQAVEAATAAGEGQAVAAEDIADPAALTGADETSRAEVASDSTVPVAADESAAQPVADPVETPVETNAASGVAAQASTTGDGPSQDAPFTMYLNNAKSPLVATMMRQSLAAQFQAQGLSVDMEVIHTGSASSSSSTGGMMSAGGAQSLSLMVTPVYILSMLASIMMVNAIGPKRTAGKRERAVGIGREAAYAIILSLLISVAETVILTQVASVDAPATIVLFYWGTSLCIMLFLLGLANVAMPLGYVAGMLMNGLGITSAMYPPEMLPTFWHDWIYPWAPHHFISEGARQVLYMGGGVWNDGMQGLAIFGLAGIVLLVVAAVVPSAVRSKREHAEDGRPAISRDAAIAA